MEKLIILSDLWGNLKSDWLVHYTSILTNHFEIQYYDCCELAAIDLEEYSEEKIHQQFINGGVERAVEKLLEKETGIVNILGFSIGGYIAWKSACQGLQVNLFTAVSSTRLRYENIQPECKINLIYGENDKNKPKEDWFNKFDLEKNIHLKEEHEFYRKKEIAIDISNEIIRMRNNKNLNRK